MIWLRHELWEYPDGLGYRLASKAETERLTAIHPEGRLAQVFYAPTPAAAEAQYCALRGMGPYMVNSADSEDSFTMGQLESQLADFPEDHRLARQPALPVPEGGHPPIPQVEHPEPAQAAVDKAHEEARHEAHDEAGDGAEPIAPADAHLDSAPEDAPADAGHPHIDPPEPHDGHGEPDAAPAHAVEQEHNPAPAIEVMDAPVHELVPEAAPKPVSDGLGPISIAESGAPSWAGRRRRKPNPFVGFLKLIWLLIVIGAVIVGVGLATGALDGPTLLTQARDLPAQLRDLPFAP